MNRIGIAIIMLLFSLTGIQAQNEVDALRFSRVMPGGTGRFMAMGGAFGAVGADFSTLSYNPAGLGLYRKSEFTFTPSFYNGKTTSLYLETKRSDSKQNFNLNNVGMVFAYEYPDKEKGLKFMQFAVGLNRMQNFNNRIVIEGFNSKNSLVDVWVNNANGIHYAEIEDDYNGYYAYDLNPAWYTYLIDTVSGSQDQYIGAIQNGRVMQRKNLTSWGSMNEFVMSVGANISEQIYLGATLGMPFIRYFEESVYSEIDTEGNYQDFSQFDLYNDLSTVGSGVNLKFGAIVRPTDWMRIGGAFHSPTWYGNITDRWSSSLDHTGFDRAYAPDGTYDYKLETPSRAIGSLAFVVSQIGLISIDYEYIDYSEARLRSSGYSYINENRAIRDVYKDASNIRVGGEMKYENYHFRGGYSVYGSPFDKGINDGEIVSYSAGFGYREAGFYIDLAFVHSIYSEDYYVYSSPYLEVAPADNTFRSNTFAVTFGFRY